MPTANMIFPPHHKYVFNITNIIPRAKVFSDSLD